MSYESEEQAIIDDDTLNKEEKRKALRNLYWDCVDNQEKPNEQYYSF